MLSSKARIIGGDEEPDSVDRISHLYRAYHIEAMRAFRENGSKARNEVVLGPINRNAVAHID